MAEETMEIIKCKHGIFKETCFFCKDMDDSIVLQEKQDALAKKNWQSSSFLDNAAHNSNLVEQEYDIEDFDLDTDYDE